MTDQEKIAQLEHENRVMRAALKIIEKKSGQLWSSAYDWKEGNRDKTSRFNYDCVQWAMDDVKTLAKFAPDGTLPYPSCVNNGYDVNGRKVKK